MKAEKKSNAKEEVSSLELTVQAELHRSMATLAGAKALLHPQRQAPRREDAEWAYELLDTALRDLDKLWDRCDPVRRRAPQDQHPADRPSLTGPLQFGIPAFEPPAGFRSGSG
jgi:hypothetical protein